MKRAKSYSCFILAIALSEFGTALAKEPSEQTYPTKPIRLLVPYGPGGSVDVLTRIVGVRLKNSVKTEFVVDNRPGGNGIVATTLASRAQPDGYTLLMASNGHASNVVLHKELPFDSVKDFTSVIHVASMPTLLAVNASQPVRTLDDLISIAKTKSKSLTYGVAGVGSSPHFCGEMLKLKTGIDMTPVAYKSGNASITGVLVNDVSMVFAGLPAILPFVRDGRIRPIAVTSLKRSSYLPDVPAIAELYPGYDIVFWVAVMAPRGVPKPVISKLNSHINAALKEANVISSFAKEGATPIGGTVQDFDVFLQKEIALARQLVKAANIKVE